MVCVMVIFMMYTIHEMVRCGNQEGWTVYGREWQRLQMRKNLMGRKNTEDLK
jgi:hypothetical protein